MESGFKTCTCCGRQWTTRNAFLGDPEVRLVGYQVHFQDLQTGLFLFNHDRDGCHSTLSVNASEFRDLYRGTVFEGVRLGAPECPGYCLHDGDLSPCPERCECSFVREILQTVKQWPKRAA